MLKMKCEEKAQVCDATKHQLNTTAGFKKLLLVYHINPTKNNYQAADLCKCNDFSIY